MKLTFSTYKDNVIPYREYILLPTLVYRDNYYLTKRYSEEEKICNYQQSLILRWLYFFIQVKLNWEDLDETN